MSCVQGPCQLGPWQVLDLDRQCRKCIICGRIAITVIIPKPVKQGDKVLWDLDNAGLKRAAKVIRQESKKYPKYMTRLPDEKFADQAARSKKPFIELWRSREFLCQIFIEDVGIERLSICRTVVDTTNRRWRDGIVWDELQQIKHEVGRGNKDAVEIFPKDDHVVNVANMRHLFVFESELSYKWKAASGENLGSK